MWLQAPRLIVHRLFRSRAEAGPPGRLGVASLDATESYWFCMFAASALGTNMGDFWVDDLSLARGPSFFSLAAISGLAIWISGKARTNNEIAFWVAIVTLRAAATNVGDFLTHDLRFSYIAVSIFFALTSLLGGHFTRFDPTRRFAPAIDYRYWITMFIAGMFGTVAGDLASHVIGLYVAAATLCGMLVAALALQRRRDDSSMMGYWIIVLVERCAGTPAGDGLASRHALGLGLPLAMVCTGAMLATGLAYRAFFVSRETVWRPAVSPDRPPKA